MHGVSAWGQVLLFAFFIQCMGSGLAFCLFHLESYRLVMRYFRRSKTKARLYFALLAYELASGKSQDLTPSVHVTPSVHDPRRAAGEARSAVRAQHSAGYRHIKVYSNLTSEAFHAILEEAALLGMTVSGHSPEGERTAGIPYKKPFEIAWEASLGKGLTTLEHIETIVWHGLRDDLAQEKMSSLAKMLAKSGEAVTPTIYAHKRLVLIAQSKGAYLSRSGSDMINPLVTWFSKDAQQYWSQVDSSIYEAPHAEFFLIATGLLHQAGVPLLAGTDSGSFGIIPGESVARELELLVAAGLSPFAALKSATRINAEVLGFEKTGMILPDYRANLILLANDPLTDVGAVEYPVGVMIGGYWLAQQELEEMKSSARSSGISSFFRSLIRVLEMKFSS